jgi:eukaryotic-like serine/threonine-protein kinase
MSEMVLARKLSVVVVTVIGTHTALARAHVGHTAMSVGPGDTIVLSGLISRDGDTLTQRALTEAARLALGESPVLTIAPPAHAHGKVRVAGSVGDSGSAFVLDLQAVDWTSGDTLAREHAVASRPETLVDALGQAVAALRVALGEPSDTVRRYATPLSRATTASLPALESWALGVVALRERGAVASVPFFARAVELDSSFVRATFDLGLAYRNSGQESLARAAWKRAFAERARADVYTAYNIAGSYYSFVTADSGKAVEAYRAWIQSYPRDYRAVSNLGSFYGDISLFPQAIAQFIAARQMNPNNVIIDEDLIELYTATGAFADARAAYAEVRRRHLDDDAPHVNMYAVAFLTHDTALMTREVAWFADRPELRHEILSEEADVAGYRGDLARARTLSTEAVQSASHAGNAEEAAAWTLNAAWREDQFGYARNAHDLALRALELAPGSREGAAMAAILLARTGDTSRAGVVLHDLDRRYADHAVERSYWLPCIRAQIALVANNPRTALQELRAAARYDAMIPQVAYYSLMPSVVLRAEAYAALGQFAQAAHEWASIIHAPGIAQLSATAPVALLQLARMHAQQTGSSAARTRAEYRAFLSLWGQAESDIPILVQARAEYSKLGRG